MKEIVTDTHEQPHVVCIIGMHRSGTSLVAHLLNFCGLELGPKESLVGRNPSNEVGHFEHRGFLELNEALMKHFGRSWDNPPVLTTGWERDSSLNTLAQQARELIATFSNIPLWGWKEPRSTILLPFWQNLIPNLRYVICIRNPLEVARSLAKRDGISISAGAQLWSQYTRAAIQYTEGQPRILTFYEDYFSNPVDEVNRLAKFCRLKAVDDSSDLEKKILGEQRHQTSSTAELLNEGSISREYKVLYLGLCAATEELYAIQTDDGIETIVADGIGSVLTLICELHDQEKLLRVETALCEKEQQLSSLQIRMREALKNENERISQLLEHTARLQAFSDAVRATWAYRFYKMFLTPFKSG